LLQGQRLQSALDDLVAWDAGFAPFADPPPDGHEYVVEATKKRPQMASFSMSASARTAFPVA
jgi:hypothetical protein